MKYKISFQGWDTEFLISESTEKMFNHFKENGLDVTLHMTGTMEDELSEDITDGVCYDTKFACDKLYHDFGPCFNGSVCMHVNRLDDDQEVYSCDLDEYNGGAVCEQEVCLLDYECRYLLVGSIYSKGYSAEYLLELKDGEEFDHKKLTLLYHEVDEDEQIITGVQYGDVDLECTGEMETKGRDERWFIEDTETGERTVQ